MRTQIFIIFLTAVLTFGSGAQTVISPGDVSGRWTISGSPYRVSGDITIPNDSTLVVDPGVVIEFQGHYALNVQGRLLAVGTHADSMITFTVNDTTGFHNSDTTLGGWYGIRMIDLPQTNDTTKLIYCRIEYGKAVGEDWFWNAGGGICILHFDKVVIADCEITSCSAGGSGFAVGGAMAIAWSDVRLSNNTITDCRADAGGAVHFYESDPVLINNVMKNNSATDGGALDIQAKSNPVLSGNLISGNYASRSGGGINIGGDSVFVALSGDTISGNYAEGGGGIYAGNCEMQINDCVLSGNGSSWIGGGIHANLSNISLEGCILHRDTATTFAGGIGVYESQLLIDNCDFTDNKAGIRGGGIHSDNSSLRIDNSIFETDSSATFGGGIAVSQSNVTINNCILRLNHAQILGGGIHSDYSNLIINNTSFEKDTSFTAGGGVFVWQSNLEIDACNFKNNFAIYSGGALYSDSTLVNIVNTTLEENRANWGGGIGIYHDTIEIADCSFSLNQSEHGGALNSEQSILNINNIAFMRNNSLWGGGISVTNCSVDIDSCVFTENSADNEGGAIEYLVDTLNAFPPYRFSLTNSQILKNSAAGMCGGIKVIQMNFDSSVTDLRIDKCEISENSSNQIGGLRVSNGIKDFRVLNTVFKGNSTALHTAGCTFSGNNTGKVENCLFAGNNAASGSPGGVGVGNSSNVDFINCTFANNSAGGGGGLHIRRGGTANVINSIFWGNSPNQISLLTVDTLGCTLTLNHCDIQDGIDSIAVSDSMSVVNWGTGNITAYPMFIDSANGDFHLQDSSDCIGAGIDSIQISGLWYYAPAFDIEENPRPDPPESRPDLGAYESSLGNPPVGVLSGGEKMPHEFKLYQNFPNPFNPTTTIKYDLPGESFVVLSVFNTLGQEVSTPVNQKQKAGFYEVRLDGSMLPSGVYFYRLHADDFIKTKKFTIVK